MVNRLIGINCAITGRKAAGIYISEYQGGEVYPDGENPDIEALSASDGSRKEST